MDKKALRNSIARCKRSGVSKLGFKVAVEKAATGMLETGVLTEEQKHAKVKGAIEFIEENWDRVPAA